MRLGDPLEFLSEVRGVVVYSDVGSDLLRLLKLFVASRRGYNEGIEKLGYLDRRASRSASRRVHKHGFPFADISSVAEAVPRGNVAGRKGRRVVKGESFGNRDHVRRRYLYVLGESSVEVHPDYFKAPLRAHGRHNHDPVARFHIRHVFAFLADNARHVHSPHVRKGHGTGGLPASKPQVYEVYRGGFYFYQDFSRSEFRLACLLVFENVGFSEFVIDDGFHCACSLSEYLPD